MKRGNLHGEISRLTAKSKEAQQTLEKERAAYAQDEKLLKGTIVCITQSEMSSRSDQASRGEEIRGQVERAKASHRSTPGIPKLIRV